MKDPIILIKGAGEKASAVGHCLYEYGFRQILMTDKALPLAERRAVCFCEALIEGRKTVEGAPSRKAENTPDAVREVWAKNEIAVLADPDLTILGSLTPDCFIDGVMAKKNTGTSRELAHLVIALGPGFTAGEDAHFVVETNPNSPALGRLITSGRTDEDTRIPTPVAGLTTERLIIAPVDGLLRSLKKIGERVEAGEVIGHVGEAPLKAAISGVIWGIYRDGIRVRRGLKIGDIDPRGEEKNVLEITPQAKTIARAVLKAVTGSFA